MKKKNATAAERAHLGRLAELGCIVCLEHYACASPAEIHHPRNGQGVGQRAGHLEAIPSAFNITVTAATGWPSMPGSANGRNATAPSASCWRRSASGWNWRRLLELEGLRRVEPQVTGRGRDSAQGERTMSIKCFVLGCQWGQPWCHRLGVELLLSRRCQRCGAERTEAVA